MGLSDALQLAGVLLTLAGLLLTAAGAVARRQTQSARAQGARIGRLEQMAVLDRVRRVQVEQILRGYDVYVPPWAPDDDLLDGDLVAQVLATITA